MTARRLVLFDVEGVLIEPDGTRRSPGAAEALARLRHESDAVLSLATGLTEEQARQRAGQAGVDRYLDLDVGSYGAAAGSVPLARRRAEDTYGCEFAVLAVTASGRTQVARLRPDVDVVVALSPTADGPPAADLRAAGAHHVVANLLDVVGLATGEDHSVTETQET